MFDLIYMKNVLIFILSGFDCRKNIKKKINVKLKSIIAKIEIIWYLNYIHYMQSTIY